ncbi:RnfABCDGE type electron transport complex subunit B [Buchnera aphidicola]|uniref:RnfABCDGE type electron transport complex subunit B n=1 Tax=Buchnera aphidicola TaxID=9 RepID=UPI0034638CCD
MFIFIVIFILSIFSFIIGLILSYSAYILRIKSDPIIEQINECFPQSQCGQCGYSGCYPYSKAIINKKEKIDKCVPGGEEVILKIAQLLNIKLTIKNALQDIKKEIVNTTVSIDEYNCVGCSKCAYFCPVDAIIGAPNFIHTVLEDFCTGCNICLLHCPTNCIKIKKRYDND